MRYGESSMWLTVRAMQQPRVIAADCRGTQLRNLRPVLQLTEADGKDQMERRCDVLDMQKLPLLASHAS